MRTSLPPDAGGRALAGAGPWAGDGWACRGRWGRDGISGNQSRFRGEAPRTMLARERTQSAREGVRGGARDANAARGGLSCLQQEDASWRVDRMHRVGRAGMRGRNSVAQQSEHSNCARHAGLRASCV